MQVHEVRGHEEPKGIPSLLRYGIIFLIPGKSPPRCVFFPLLAGIPGCAGEIFYIR